MFFASKATHLGTAKSEITLMQSLMPVFKIKNNWFPGEMISLHPWLCIVSSSSFTWELGLLFMAASIYYPDRSECELLTQVFLWNFHSILNILVSPSGPNSQKDPLYPLPPNLLSYFLINSFTYFNPLSTISVAHVNRNVRSSTRVGRTYLWPYP